MVVRMIALVARIGSRLFADVDVQGLDHIPRRGAGDPRRQPHLERRPRRRRRLDHRRPQAAPDPLAGQARAVRLARRRLAGRPRRHPPGRPRRRRTSRRSASRRRSSRTATSCSCSPRAPAAPPASSRRRRTASRCSPSAPARQIVPIGVNNTDAVWRKGRKLPLPFPRRRITVRIGTPFRVQDVIPADVGRREAKRLATTADHGPDRGPARSPPPGRLCRRRAARTEPPKR